MKVTLCIGAILVLMSCKRYTCECNNLTLQNSSNDYYVVTAHDQQEAKNKCEYKNKKNSIGTRRSSCVIK
ncbi:MAG: hypothetical protein K0S32_3756 [Bacteroidetes bacterium]|nr:hypothetical protein [Bacteroidota bacterium]